MTHANHRALLSIWALLTATGSVALWSYGSNPGDSGAPPAEWPLQATDPLRERSPTLVVFVHSECPCTAATMNELERALVQIRRPVNLDLVVYVPKIVDQTRHDRIVALRRRFPDAAIHADNAVALCNLFGVVTSGHVLLYDQDGRLRYSGGITASRGHEGDNLGRGALIEALRQESETARQFPVFGCRIVPTNGFKNS